MAKLEVTPLQLGHLLFGFAIETAHNNLKDEKAINDFGMDKLDHNTQLFQEMIIIEMFAIVLSIKGLLENREVENEILDAMFTSYCIELTKNLNFNKEQLGNEQTKVLARYNEYNNAMKEKNPVDNWLWSLSKHMLNNLDKKERGKNAFAIMWMTSIISATTTSIPDLINKYDIKK